MSINPIAKKLGFKPLQRILLIDAPAGYPELLEPLPDGVNFETIPGGTYDMILFFAKNSAELQKTARWISAHLLPETIFWIAYPKKKSGIETDLGMMSSWPAIEEIGYECVMAASIDERYTALRFKPANLIKHSTTSASAIGQSELAEFIDTVNREIKLPPHIQQEFEKHPKALSFFNTLSFTNKKEYAVWLLGAKQEKTREERLAKTIEKLLSGKKNPAEK